MSNIGSNTRPLRDIDGFDSYSGVEASVLLSNSLGCLIPDEVFVPEAGRHLLSISEIADNVCEHMNARNNRR